MQLHTWHTFRLQFKSCFCIYARTSWRVVLDRINLLVVLLKGVKWVMPKWCVAGAAEEWSGYGSMFSVVMSMFGIFFLVHRCFAWHLSDAAHSHHLMTGFLYPNMTHPILYALTETQTMSYIHSGTTINMIVVACTFWKKCHALFILSPFGANPSSSTSLHPLVQSLGIKLASSIPSPLIYKSGHIRIDLFFA